MLTLLAPIAMQDSEHWVFIERETPRVEAVALRKALGVKKEARAGTSEVKMSTSVSKVEMAVGKAKEVAGQEEPADAALDTRTRAKMIASPEDFESVWEDEVYGKETREEPSLKAESLPAESKEEPREQGKEVTTGEPGLPKPHQQPEEKQRAKTGEPELPQGESELFSKERASAACRKQEARVPATELIKIKVKANDESSESSATQRIIYLGDPEEEEKDSKNLFSETGAWLGLEERAEAAANAPREGSGHMVSAEDGFLPLSSASQQHRAVSGKPAEALEQPWAGWDGTGQEEGLPLQQGKASAVLTGCRAPERGEALLSSQQVGPEDKDQSPVGGSKPCALAGDGHGVEEHKGSPVQSPDICMAVEGLSGTIVDKEESARVILQMEEIETQSPPSAVPEQDHPHTTAGSEGDKPSSPAPMSCPHQSTPVPAEPAPGTETEARAVSQGTSPVRGVGIAKDVNPAAEVACKEASPVVGRGAPKDVSPVSEVAIPWGTNPESEEQPQDVAWKPCQDASPVARGLPQSTDAAAEPIQVRDPATGEVAQDIDPVTARATQSKVPATEEPLQEEKPMIKELSSGKLTRDEGCGMEELSHDKSPCIEELPPKAEKTEQQTIIRDLPQEGPMAEGLLYTADPKVQEPPWDLEFNVGQDLQCRSPTGGETARDSDLTLGQPTQDKSSPKEDADVLHSNAPVAGLCQGSKTYRLSTLTFEGGEELQVSTGTHPIESGSLMCVAGRTGAVSQEHGDVASGSCQDSESYRKTSVASRIKMFEQSEEERRAAQEDQGSMPEAERAAEALGKMGLAMPVAPVGPASSVGSSALGQGAGSGDTSQALSLKEDVSVGVEHEGEDSADLASPDSGCELTLAEAVVTLPMNCPDGKFMRMLCGSL